MSSNNEGKFSILEGGVPRMQFGAPADEQQDSVPAFRGHQTPGQDVRQSHSEIIRHMHGNGILGTANEARLRPETLVRMQGVQFTLKSAEEDGLVHRDANGIYREGPPPGYATREQQAQRAPELTPAEAERQAAEDSLINEMKPELVRPDVEAALAEAVKDVPAEMHNAALVDVVASLAEGQQFDPRKFASETGMPEERAGEYVQAYCTVLANQADGLFSAEGISQEEFFTWAKSQRMPELKRALAAHATARTMSGYRTLIKEFKHSPTGRKQANVR